MMEESGYDILVEGLPEVVLSEGSGPIETDASEGEQLVVMESMTPTPAPPHVPILLVDDDEELCRMFGALFRRKGFDVTTSQDGLAGYEAAVSGAFELLIADLNMPKMDGWGCSASSVTTTGPASCPSRCSAARTPIASRSRRWTPGRRPTSRRRSASRRW
jgi:hypothetical protein